MTTNSRKPISLFAALLATSLACAGTVAEAGAATLHVAPGAVLVASDEVCSLREAIMNANDDADTHPDCTGVGTYGDDIIELADSTYTLPDGPFSADGNNGLPSIVGPLTIHGNGAIIERDAEAATDFRILHVAASAQSFALDDTTVRNGRASGAGLAPRGGGMLARSASALSGCTFTANHATDNGGAIAYIGPNTCSVTDSTFANNSSAGNGGAIHNGEAHVLNISGSTIRDNQATGSGGGITNFGEVNTTCTTISGNDAASGGGLSNNTTGQARIERSTFSDNDALGTTAFTGFGGGIYHTGGNFNNTGTEGLYVVNSTISGNRAANDGGGIFNWSGNVFLFSSTIAGNRADADDTDDGSGGGVANFGNASQFSSATFPALVEFGNTLIADNSDGGNGANDCIDLQQAPLMTMFHSLGHNLVEDSAGCAITEVANVGTDIAGVDPGLGSLARDEGACSATQCPIGPPAVDGGAPSMTSCTGGEDVELTIDQRGLPRPHAGVCDIGACEVQPPPATATTTPTPSATATVALPTLTPTLTPGETPTDPPTATATPTATETPTLPPAPVCGDGLIEGDEQCDPGADVEGDCCSAECGFATPGTTCNAGSCTADTCNESGACVVGETLGDGEPCDDGDACTSPDTCQAGACSGTAISCDDGFDCTQDTCDPVAGCINLATIESRDCPGSCTDGINNDPTDPNDPLHDPNNPDNDGDIDLEDTGCATLASIARFGIVGTRDRKHRDLKLGSDVNIASTEVDGSCDLNTDTCACPVTECEPFVVCNNDSDCSVGTCNTGTNKCECTVNCPVSGDPCQGDEDCLFEVDGTCNPGSSLCGCPDYAPNCQPLNRPCSDDSDCGSSPYPNGASLGGVCGNGMQISAGVNMGLLASITTSNRSKLQFGTAESGDSERTLDIKREFANAGGTIQVGDPAPFVGPTVCSDNTSQACTNDSDCAAGTCDVRRRLLDGNPFETFDGQPDQGLAGAGTSENFKRCDVAVTVLESGGNNDPSELQEAIANYSPAPGEVVTMGPGTCLECPNVDSLDAACTPCDPGEDTIRTKANTKKVILTFGSGLQVLDLRRVALAGKTVMILRGQPDSEVLIRVDRSLRNGSESKMILEGMTSDQVLWVALGRFGGKPRVSGASTWRGSILATERRSGIFLGAQSYTEGGIYGQRILVKGPDTTIQHFPWKGKLPSVP